jgi:hypothetical protein
MICFARAGDDDDWLSPPDGYIWPSRHKEQVTDEQTVSVKCFPKTYQDAILACFSGEPPTDVTIRKADLNADRKAEIFLYIPESSGTGGSVYTILSPAKDGIVDVGAVQGGITLCEPVDGWLQIEAGSRAGGGQFTRSLLRFADGQYREVRNEDHNLIENKVTLRHADQTDALTSNAFGTLGTSPEEQALVPKASGSK